MGFRLLQPIYLLLDDDQLDRLPIACILICVKKIFLPHFSLRFRTVLVTLKIYSRRMTTLFARNKNMTFR